MTANPTGSPILKRVGEDTLLGDGYAEVARLRELLTHARDGGEVQNCEGCGQWFRLEETHSMDEGGWICKGCAGSGDEHGKL